MARVDGIAHLPLLLPVDNNLVVCQAAKSPNGHTVVVLITEADAWVKTQRISAPNVYGFELQCGDLVGNRMHGLNANMKFNRVDLGYDVGNVAIQFIKPKFLGIKTDYGTLGLPDALRGHTVAFFWPCDVAGDHWNHFISHLTQVQHVFGSVGGVANGVVRVGQSAADFLSLFA